jgi:predicted aspartyl protease
MRPGFRIAACAIAVFLIPSAACADAPVPSASTILGNVRHAVGPTLLVYRERIEYTRADGTVSAERIFHFAGSTRSTLSSPPIHSEWGRFGDQSWHQNENGQTILDQDPPRVDESARNVADDDAATVTSIAGGSAYRLTTVNGANSFERDVDARTWQIVHTRRIRPTGTIDTTYSDFRTDVGRTFAHRWHTDDRVHGIVEDANIVQYASDGVTGDDVAIPAPRRALVEIPAGMKRIVLPGHTDDAQKFHVNVNIDGRDRDFILDTGAAAIVIDEALARTLKLKRYDEEIGHNAGSAAQSRAIVSEMRVGPLVMHDVAVVIAPSRLTNSPSETDQGLLGFDFLAELGVTLNYQERRVEVVPAATYEPPIDPLTYALDVRLGSQTPQTTVLINGAPGDDWTLDSGGSGTFMIFDAFARAHPSAVTDAHGGGAFSEEVYDPTQFIGVGGEFKTEPYEISDLTLGHLHFNGFRGYRVTSAQSFAGDDGYIGVGFLHFFNVDLDYAHGRVYLVPRPVMRGYITPKKS